MKSLHWIVLLTCSLVGLVAPASATIISYNVNLDGTQAGSGSPGVGFALLTLDDVAETLLVNLSYSGLLAPVTNAHIHCCAAPGSNAPVVIPFVPEGFLTGATSGTFNATINLTPTLVADIESDLSYINLHTNLYPGGEVRGQIVKPTTAPVPEPGTLMLSVAGAVGLWSSRKK